MNGLLSPSGVKSRTMSYGREASSLHVIKEKDEEEGVTPTKIKVNSAGNSGPQVQATIPSVPVLDDAEGEEEELGMSQLSFHSAASTSSKGDTSPVQKGDE